MHSSLWTQGSPSSSAANSPSSGRVSVMAASCRIQGSSPSRASQRLAAYRLAEMPEKLEAKAQARRASSRSMPWPKSAWPWPSSTNEPL